MIVLELNDRLKQKIKKHKILKLLDLKIGSGSKLGPKARTQAWVFWVKGEDYLRPLKIDIAVSFLGDIMKNLQNSDSPSKS